LKDLKISLMTNLLILLPLFQLLTLKKKKKKSLPRKRRKKKSLPRKRKKKKSQPKKRKMKIKAQDLYLQ